MPRSRQILLASVSSLALLLSVPTVRAADLSTNPPLPTKAPPPPPVVRSPWTWWIEGGAQQVAGDPIVAGLYPTFDARANHWGPTGAIGVTYQYSDLYAFDFDFRIGANRRTTNSFQFACLGSSSCFTPISGPNSATRKELNWVTDFMLGREIGIGGGPAQIEAGIRIAQIRGTTNGSAAMASSPPPFTSFDVYTQKNYFFGAGPRVAVDGSVPLTGALSLQYMFGVAGLISYRSTDQTATFTNGSGQGCFSGCALNISTSDNTIVANPDATIGLIYALSHTLSVSLNFHVDTYFAAFKAFNAAGNPVNVDRIYYSPNIRLTWQPGS